MTPEQKHNRQQLAKGIRVVREADADELTLLDEV